MMRKQISVLAHSDYGSGVVPANKYRFTSALTTDTIMYSSTDAGYPYLLGTFHSRLLQILHLWSVYTSILHPHPQDPIFRS